MCGRSVMRPPERVTASIYAGGSGIYQGGEKRTGSRASKVKITYFTGSTANVNGSAMTVPARGRTARPSYFSPSIRNSPSHFTSELVLLTHQVDRLFQVGDLDVNFLPATQDQHVGHEEHAVHGHRQATTTGEKQPRRQAAGDGQLEGHLAASCPGRCGRRIAGPPARPGRGSARPPCWLRAGSTRRRGSGPRGCARRRRTVGRPPAPRPSPGRSRCDSPGRRGKPPTPSIHRKNRFGSGCGGSSGRGRRVGERDGVGQLRRRLDGFRLKHLPGPVAGLLGFAVTRGRGKHFVGAAEHLGPVGSRRPPPAASARRRGSDPRGRSAAPRTGRARRCECRAAGERGPGPAGLARTRRDRRGRWPICQSRAGFFQSAAEPGESAGRSRRRAIASRACSGLPASSMARISARARR